ncbi:MAG: protein translocase subunit, partial [Bacteriovoracaceae bacterium]|nr:protein translocase subunit [Bacteriovoracaceae bacterium]
YRVRMNTPEELASHEEMIEARKQAIEKQIEDEQKEREQRVQKLNLFSGPKGGDSAKAATVKREAEKVGRNDPCPCGSGKKYKKCHGANAATG